MKKFALALVVTAAFAGSASAADLAARPYTKAPPVVAPVASWTGCYLNAGFGYGLFDDQRSVSTVDGPVRPNSTSAGKGWLGSFGGGCDYQFNSATPFGPIVVGVFGDYDPGSIKGAYSDPLDSYKAGTAKISSQYFVGARVGLLVTPSVLTYISGGWTGAHINQIDLFYLDGDYSNDSLPSHNASGWFLGSGFEYSFNFLPIKGLFWRNEYRYASYNNFDQNYIHPTFVGSRYTVNSTVDVQTITTSLVWRFGMP